MKLNKNVALNTRTWNNKDFPLVSVCIPVYNGKNFLMESIQSVFVQKYPNLEILIQDNASTDGSWEIIEKLNITYPNIFVERNKSNLGMSSNWNWVINRAKGDYIILLSADDLLEEGFIEHCLYLFNKKKIDVVTTNHFYLLDNKKSVRKINIKEGIYHRFYKRILLQNPFSINFTMFNRSTLEEIKQHGALFSSLMTCDYDLWIRLGLSDKKIYYVSKPLGSYRIHKNNLSNQRQRMLRQASLTVMRHRRNLKLFDNLVYRFSLFRFILRFLKIKMEYSVLNKRIIIVLWRELTRY